jgi:hypothetical protein
MYINMNRSVSHRRRGEARQVSAGRRLVVLPSLTTRRQHPSRLMVPLLPRLSFARMLSMLVPDDTCRRRGHVQRKMACCGCFEAGFCVVSEQKFFDPHPNNQNAAASPWPFCSTT